MIRAIIEFFQFRAWRRRHLAQQGRSDPKMFKRMGRYRISHGISEEADWSRYTRDLL